MSLFTFDFTGPGPASAPLALPSAPLARSQQRFDEHLEGASRTRAETPAVPQPFNDDEPASNHATSDVDTRTVARRSSRDEPESQKEDSERENQDRSAEDSSETAAAAANMQPAPKEPLPKRRAGQPAQHEDVKVLPKPAKHGASKARVARGEAAGEATASTDASAASVGSGETDSASREVDAATSGQDTQPAPASVETGNARIDADGSQANNAALVAPGQIESPAPTDNEPPSASETTRPIASEVQLAAAHGVDKTDRKSTRGVKTSGEPPRSTPGAGKEPHSDSTDVLLNALEVLAVEPAEATLQADADEPKGQAAPTDARQKSDARDAAAPLLLTSRHEKAHSSDGRSDSLSEADRVRFVQRVARAFHSMGDEGGEVRLRLSPPELGSLRLELAVRDGVLSAHLETETTQARNLLLDNLPVLRERLAEQNIKVEKFDVNVRDQQSQSGGQQFTDHADVPRQTHRQRQRSIEARRATTAQPIERAIGRRDLPGESNRELNIVI